MYKISYIGGNGKIGTNVLLMLVNQCPKDVEIDIVLLSSGKSNSISRLTGLIKELDSIIILRQLNINFFVTNDYEYIANSDIIVCSVNKESTFEQVEFFKQFDNTGRLVQAFVNKDLVLDIAGKVARYSKNSLFLLITNQVDILCHIVRENFPGLNVVGVGGFVDSVRLRQIIYNRYNIITNSFMIGYHNNDMFALLDTIKIKVTNDELYKINNLVRDYGAEISEELGHGSTILPAKAIFDFINAYLFDVTLVSCYNVDVHDISVAKKYDIMVGTYISVPIVVKKFSVSFLDNIKISNMEKIKIKTCINNLKNDINLVTNCII